LTVINLFYVRVDVVSRARPSQRTRGGNWLNDGITQEIGRYTRDEAIKKARMFGGRIESAAVWENLAYAEYKRTRGLSAFNLAGATQRKLNQHATRYNFLDGSWLIVHVTCNAMTCYNTRGEPQATRVLFGNYASGKVAALCNTI
jgi:hypothetical protein